jgi:hypothetical protein
LLPESSPLPPKGLSPPTLPELDIRMFELEKDALNSWVAKIEPDRNPRAALLFLLVLAYLETD